MNIKVVRAVLMSSGGNIARARDALRFLSVAQPGQASGGNEQDEVFGVVESNEVFARDLQAELNRKK